MPQTIEVGRTVVLPDLLDRLGQHQRGGDGVRAGDRVVDDVDRLVGTHLQRLAGGVDGLLGADAQRGHRVIGGLAPDLLLDLQGLLDGVLVQLGQQPVHADAVNGVVRLELPIGSRIRYVLHTDDNVHGVWPRGPSCDVDSHEPAGPLESEDCAGEVTSE